MERSTVFLHHVVPSIFAHSRPPITLALASYKADLCLIYQRDPARRDSRHIIWKEAQIICATISRHQLPRPSLKYLFLPLTFVFVLLGILLVVYNLEQPDSCVVNVGMTQENADASHATERETMWSNLRRQSTYSSREEDREHYDIGIDDEQDHITLTGI